MTRDSESVRDDQGRRSAGPDRRDFLKAGALATGAAAFANPLAAASPAAPAPAPRRGTGKTTVVLFQRGGADQLNLFAPTGDVNYRVHRPTIGVDAPGSSGPVEGLAMDPMFAMHPSMPGLHAAYSAPGSTLAVVHAVGQLPYNRSHFESQDLFETGYFTNAHADGWINRHLQATATPQDPPVRALALRGSLPRILAGAYPTFAVATTADFAFFGQADVRAFLELITDYTPTAAMSAQRQLAYRSAIDAFDLVDHFSVLAPATYVPANGAVYPNTSLGRAMKQAAELIKANLGVEFIAVDQNGWDHHSSLVTRIATYAADYDASITAFLTDLGAAMADVVLVTMSEFGREVRQNGSLGTDHGAGGAMVIAGGPVRGGTMHGNWPGLAPGALQDGRFLAPVNDFRNVLLEVLQDHMGGTDPALVFPGHVYSPIGVI